MGTGTIRNNLDGVSRVIYYMENMDMKRYLYLELETDAPIIVFAWRRQSQLTVPESGAWVLKEWDGKKWQMPCYPEVTWGVLKKLKYVGRII